MSLRGYWLNNRYRLLAACVVAFLVTGAVRIVDHFRANIAVSDSTLPWARQISSQVEGLSLVAKEKNESDPIAWAAEKFNQGAEPRIVKVTKWKGPPGKAKEIYELDEFDRYFKYSRVLLPEEGLGVQIIVDTGYTGFLGSKTRFSNDVAFTLFFFMMMAVFAVLFKKPPVRKEDPQFKQKVRVWIQGAKTLLTEFGANIRDFLRAVHHLANSVSKSRETLGTLRERIVSETHELQDARHSLQEAGEMGSQAEALALNLVIAANRMGEGGKELTGMIEELHGVIQKLRQLNQKNETTIQNIEAQVQPWATDMDIAFQFYEDVFNTLQEMNGGIEKTSASLGNQVKHIQSFTSEVGTSTGLASGSGDFFLEPARKIWTRFTQFKKTGSD